MLHISHPCSISLVLCHWLHLPQWWISRLPFCPQDSEQNTKGIHLLTSSYHTGAPKQGALCDFYCFFNYSALYYVNEHLSMFIVQQKLITAKRENQLRQRFTVENLSASEVINLLSFRCFLMQNQLQCAASTCMCVNVSAGETDFWLSQSTMHTCLTPPKNDTHMHTHTNSTFFALLCMLVNFELICDYIIQRYNLSLIAGFRCVRKHTNTHKGICLHSITLLHKPSAYHVEAGRTNF